MTGGRLPVRGPKTGRATAPSCPAARHGGPRAGRTTSPRCRPGLCVMVYKGGLLMWQDQLREPGRVSGCRPEH